jgi:hypothetical protein
MNDLNILSEYEGLLPNSNQKFESSKSLMKDDTYFLFDSRVLNLGNHLISLIQKQKIINNFSKTQEYAFQLRGSIVEWLFMISSKLNARPQTFFKSVNLLDTYLMNLEIKLEKEKVQLIAAVCYFIATKVEEVESFNLQFLKTGLLKDKFKLEDITQTEVKILQKVKFQMHNISINDFSEIFIEMLRYYLLLSNSLIAINIELFAKLFHFVNIMSLLVEELIFDMEGFKIALINFRTTLLFFKMNGIISMEDLIKLDKIIDHFFSMFAKKYYPDLSLEEDIYPISDCLLEAIINQQESPRKKAFFSILEEFISLYRQQQDILNY